LTSHHCRFSFFFSFLFAIDQSILFFSSAKSGKGESNIHAQAQKKKSSKKDTKEKKILTEEKEK
jgi:hypothetical protein